MNDLLDDVATGSTRPSSPRTMLGTAAFGESSLGGTTLPVIRWGESGATLEPSALPRYERLELLGEGGMGEVLRARDNDIGRDVAVKRLRSDLQHPELFARFVEEVRTIGQLEHPNIPPIHDAGIDQEGYFFVMKHVQGETLANIIERLDAGDAAAHLRWPMERRIDVIRKVLEALRYAHSRGVVHRDIKPANILVGPMGEVFLLDWGIARRDRPAGSEPVAPHAPVAAAVPLAPFTPVAKTLVPGTGSMSALHTRVGSVMGTPLYMSPEQARGEVVDARSDLYSLCMTLYEFATLHHPFAHHQDTAALLKAVVSEPVPLAGFVKHPHQISPPMDLTHVLKKGIAKDANERFQSADELIRRLDDRAEGKVPIQCHVTFTKRTSYEAMKLVNRFPRGFSVVLVAGLVGALYLLLR